MLQVDERGVARARLRVLFAVQGEGRGHMTQALALREMLLARGHVVCGAIVGASLRRQIPEFFRAGLLAPIFQVESPSFVSSSAGAIRPGATAWRALREMPRISGRLDSIARAMDKVEPDVVVNFYEGTMGAFTQLRVLDAPVVAIAHQFMTEHPRYPLQKRQPTHRLAMQAYTRLAGAGATIRLGLSFYPADDLPRRKLRVVPPLLRKQLFGLSETESDESILVYLMEPALAHALIAWSDANPNVRIHCFCEGTAHEHSPSLTFHALCGTSFLTHMARARGVVCTAGFEAVSEALWLGKPALMVPAPNHYEQRCNAVDGEMFGAGIASHVLNLDRLLDVPTRPACDTIAYRAWVAEAESRVVGAIESVAESGQPLRPVHSAMAETPDFRQAA